MKQKITLVADEGKILTDGIHYGRIVHLVHGDNGEAWHEITEAEYEALSRSEETI